jgi:hypothetical protein
MGYFAFSGKNSIFQDLIAELPNGTIYLKEDNVIPFEMQVTFWETFDILKYPVGTDVDVFVNNVWTAKVKISMTKSIYLKMSTPYGKFTVRTEIAGKVYNDQPFYALNLLSFLVSLAKTYTYDYTELFNMFGNIWNKTLQLDWLYNKVGWFYDFGRPSGWSIDDYQYIIIGSPNNIQVNYLFMNAMTVWSMKELVKSFTGMYPTMHTWRDENGWIIADDNIPFNLPFKNYYLVEEWTYLGSNNVIGLNLNGYEMQIQIDGTTYDINFTLTTGGTDIVNQINAVVGSPLASVVSSGGMDYIQLYMTGVNLVLIKSGTALMPLGFSSFEQDAFVDTGDDIITLYDEAYLWNKLDLIINNGTKLINEGVTKSAGTQDILKHLNVLDTPLHPLTITGFVKNVDYNLIEYPVGTNQYCIEWLNPPMLMQGSADVTGHNLQSQTLTLSVNDELITMTFNNTQSGADIISQINARFTLPYASVITVGLQHFIVLSGWGIKIIGGTALGSLGFTAGQTIGLPQKGDKYIVIYSYFIKEDLIPLCELNKPAYLKINYYFME